MDFTTQLNSPTALPSVSGITTSLPQFTFGSFYTLLTSFSNMWVVSQGEVLKAHNEEAISSLGTRDELSGQGNLSSSSSSRFKNGNHSQTRRRSLVLRKPMTAPEGYRCIVPQKPIADKNLPVPKLAARRLKRQGAFRNLMMVPLPPPSRTFPLQAEKSIDYVDCGDHFKLVTTEEAERYYCAVPEGYSSMARYHNFPDITDEELLREKLGATLVRRIPRRSSRLSSGTTAPLRGKGVKRVRFEEPDDVDARPARRVRIHYS